MKISPIKLLFSCHKVESSKYLICIDKSFLFEDSSLMQLYRIIQLTKRALTYTIYFLVQNTTDTGLEIWLSSLHTTFSPHLLSFSKKYREKEHHKDYRWWYLYFYFPHTILWLFLQNSQLNLPCYPTHQMEIIDYGYFKWRPDSKR